MLKIVLKGDFLQQSAAKIGMLLSSNTLFSSPLLPMQHFVIFMEGIEGADRFNHSFYVESVKRSQYSWIRQSVSTDFNAKICCKKNTNYAEEED